MGEAVFRLSWKDSGVRWAEMRWESRIKQNRRWSRVQALKGDCAGR